ncbi:hypothetical protein [Streptomyces erythrochromogenes]|uniref:hypothetical protein n=1 Tax=Streptomyces erythrochromogenes TaxID=285574 RepID=UPI00225BE85C|nr:hypothetical protein [Streptomyces erythrochromogenes]MCX5583204.1 hypothetical protein [Streptomyces erythrochromogenes]
MAVVGGFAVLEAAVSLGGLFHLLGDAVDVARDEVVEVDGEGFAVAFHGADGVVDDLVVEGAHPAAAEGGQDVVLE